MKSETDYRSDTSRLPYSTVPVELAVDDVVSVSGAALDEPLATVVSPDVPDTVASANVIDGLANQ